MKVDFDVTANNTAQCPDQFVNLAGVCAAHGVRNADSVDTDLVDSLVDREQVDEIRAE